jgi:hypothetical protein
MTRHTGFDGLEDLLDRIRTRVRAREHGSILVLVEVEEGVMTTCELHETHQVMGDVVRVMREAPRRVREVPRCR